MMGGIGPVVTPWAQWVQQLPVRFHGHNPLGRTMALGSTQPLTEMSTGNISWGWRRPVRKADFTTFKCRLSWNLGASASFNPQGLSRPVMGLLYLLPLPFTLYLYIPTATVTARGVHMSTGVLRENIWPESNVIAARSLLIKFSKRLK